MSNKKFKICIGCGKEKELSEFGKHSDHIDGLKYGEQETRPRMIEDIRKYQKYY